MFTETITTEEPDSDDSTHEDALHILNIDSKNSKKNFCKFCKKAVIKMSRHLRSVHSREVELIELKTLPIKSDRRREILEIIRREGNYLHNKDSIDRDGGSIMPQMRPPNYKKSEANSFLACVYCKGFFGRKFLYKHHQRCFMNKTNDKRKHASFEAQLMMNSNMYSVSELFKENIIIDMLNDEITKTAVDDRLILKFGESVFKRLKKKHNANYIRQRMRQMARLLMIANNIDDKIKNIEELIKPINFDTIIQSVQIMAEYDESTGKFGVVALPLKIGHNLRKCATVLQTHGIKTSNKEIIEECKHFLDLMNDEYISVSSQALSSAAHKKFNKPKYLPLTEDVKKFTEFMQLRISVYSDELRTKGDCESYQNLAKSVLVSILLFNRRRTGEIQRITIEDFLKGIAAKSSIDVSDDISAIEKMLMDKLKRIEIIGKKGRGVPVLLRSLHVEAVKLLLEHRPSVGIPEGNEFLFARISSYAKTPLDACKEMRELSSLAGLKSPERIRSTLLRKHIATISQICSLTNVELSQLATFMGHDLNVHMDHYRLPDDVLQITKVGRLLIAAEEGKFSRGKHMNLSDIPIDEEEIEGISLNDSSLNRILTEGELSNSSGHFVSRNLKERNSKQRKKFTRKMWQPVEKTLVENYFKKNISKITIPGKHECLDFLHQNPTIQRSWCNIKDYIRNINLSTK